MTKQYFFLFISILICCSHVFAQERNDFPSDYPGYSVEDGYTTIYQLCNGNQVKYREILGNEGREYYCSGNLYAAGPIVLSDSSSITYSEAEGDKEKTKFSYLRDGKWKVYFDSSSGILRAEGSYKEGREDGLWIIYRLDGTPAKEYQFENGIKKTETSIDEVGYITSLVSLSSTRIFYEHNKELLLIVMLLFVVGIRSLWNLVTFNKIRGKKHNSVLSYWKDGGWNDALLAPVIFWWLSSANDSTAVAFYKRIGNTICVLSIILFISVMALSMS